MKRLALVATLICSFAIIAAAQQTESRVALNQPATRR